MRVVILGSGLLGVTLAYVLASRGHEVEVLERKSESGAETSYANGGQLSYSVAEPWATPGVLKKLPKWLLDPDSPLIFRPRLDFAMFRWGLSFLLNCRAKKAARSTVHILRLGLYTRRKMEDIMNETGIAFDYSPGGILQTYATEADLAAAVRQFEFQRKFGGEHRVLDRAGVLAMEPSLSPSEVPLAGGVHLPLDASGDAYLFCRELTRLCAEKLNVRFRFGVTAERIVAEQDRIAGVVTSGGDVRADAYVLALGSYSPLYAKPLGIRLPVYPMKGYSLTVPRTGAAPRLSVTDNSRKIVFTPLGHRLRVAGTAEFAGYDDTVQPRRLAPILNACRRLYPRINWDERNHEWACLRPSTPDGPPVLGATPFANLYFNTGHGTLGWTHAAGSAWIVADLMEGKNPEIMLDGLTLERR